MNSLLAYFDAQLAVQCLQVGAGLVMAITAAEILEQFQVYAKSGVLSWDLGRRTPQVANNSFIRRIGDFFYHDERFRVLFAIRLGLGLGMATCGCIDYLSPSLIAAAILSSLIVLYRANQGQDGSFQLRLLILFVLFACSISPTDSLPYKLGLYFLSAQLILSYLIAGIAKLRGKTWRDGTGLTGIMGTVYHGIRWGHKILAKRPTLTKVLSWSVITFEVLFPLVLTGNAWIIAGFLTITTLFHLATSFLMGLNGFFLSFAAAYPTLIFCLSELPWVKW